MNITKKYQPWLKDFHYSIVTLDNKDIVRYLSQYLTAAKIDSPNSMELLLQKEKLLQDKINNSNQYDITKLAAWNDYFNWIVQLIPNNNKDLRIFLALEYYTQMMAYENSFYSSKEYIYLWLSYIDMCRDDLSVFQYMTKNDICTKNNCLYESMAIINEKYHDFKQANQCYLNAIEIKVENIPELQRKYKQFEGRMEKRINRDIAQSSLSNEVINKRLMEDITKRNEPKYNENRKRSLPLNMISLTFTIKNNKIIFTNNSSLRSSKTADNHLTVNYGNVPVYVDEECRDNLITRATQIVEIYDLLIIFLLEKDLKFHEENEKYLKDLQAEYEKRPYSWVSQKRQTGIQSIDYPSFNSSKEEENSFHQHAINYKQPTIDNVILNIGNDINESNIKIKAKEKSKPQEIPHLNIKEIEPLIPKSQSVVLPPAVKGKKEINIVKKSYNEQGISLIDQRIAFYKEKLAKIEAKKKEEMEMNKITQINPLNNITFDSDGDLCMCSDHDSDWKKPKNIQSKTIPSTIVPGPFKLPTNANEPNTTVNPSITHHPINEIKPKPKSPPKKSNPFEKLVELKPFKREEPDSKGNTIQNPMIQLPKNMTSDDINSLRNKIEDQYQSRKINKITRDQYYRIVEEKEVEMAKNKGVQSKPQQYEIDSLDCYLKPSTDIQNIKPISKGNNPIDFNNIKPLIIKDTISPIKHINKLNNNQQHQSIANFFNYFNDTPEKTEQSISFDSNHSHLFNENKKPFEENNNQQIIPKNNFNSFSDIFQNESNSSRENNKRNSNDINSLFSNNEDNYNKPNPKTNKLSNDRLAQIFMSDDENQSDDEQNNPTNDVNNNNPNQQMSSITEKTIEHTRNSSANSLSLEKLFKS